MIPAGESVRSSSRLQDNQAAGQASVLRLADLFAGKVALCRDMHDGRGQPAGQRPGVLWHKIPWGAHFGRVRLLPPTLEATM
jgi:hypothetical protein